MQAPEVIFNNASLEEMERILNNSLPGYVGELGRLSHTTDFKRSFRGEPILSETITPADFPNFREFVPKKLPNRAPMYFVKGERLVGYIAPAEAIQRKIARYMSAYLHEHSQKKVSLRSLCNDEVIGGGITLVGITSTNVLMLRPMITAKYSDTFRNEEEYYVPIKHFACLMRTNNINNAIVLIYPFPRCLTIKIDMTDNCLIDFYASIMDAVMHIKMQPKPSPVISLNANIILNSAEILGRGKQGAVFNIDDNNVLKLIDISFPGIMGTVIPLISETNAIKEVLILYYLQSKKFAFAPAPKAYGYCNGLFFYILMSKITGGRAESKDYNQCLLSVEEMHRLGVAHLDLHPGNLLTNRLGCFLLDFGFAESMSLKPEEFKEYDVASLQQLHGINSPTVPENDDVLRRINASRENSKKK